MSKRAIYLGGKRGSGAAAEAVETTFGPEIASDDWWVSETSMMGMGGASFDATPSEAKIGDDSLSDLGYMTYAMMWDLDVAAGVTIVSATLRVECFGNNA